MASVTSIHENIIEKHYTEEDGVYVENNAEPSLKTQSGKKCRSKPTASFQPEKKEIKILLEIPFAAIRGDRSRAWASSTTGNNYRRSLKLWSRTDFQQLERSRKRSQTLQ